MKDASEKAPEKAAEKVPEKATEFALIQLLPNMLTVAAICAGMSAIRFALQGDYTFAVLLIVAAGVLDGLDGRLARMMHVDSKMGAELDSLADFLNFGVAPPLVIYFWALQDMPRAAWISVLIYTVCSVVRLARFNVSAKSDTETPDSSYFTGVPSPAAALLVMFPMLASFAFADGPIFSGFVICANMILIGLLMISRIPTWSFKTTKVSRENVKYFLVAFAFVGAALLTYAWVTLVVVCLIYLAMVVWGLFKKKS